MKRCPVCNAVYNDDMLIKCTNCGADLVEVQPEQPTYTNTPPQNNYAQYNAYNSQFKICPNCGNHCDPRAVICVKCGIQFPEALNKKPRPDDKPIGIVKLLCFFIPLLGLILYLVNMNDKPTSAKAYGKMSLIGFIVGIVIYIGIIILSVLSMTVSFSAPIISTYPDSEFFYSIINNLF